MAPRRDRLRLAHRRIPRRALLPQCRRRPRGDRAAMAEHRRNVRRGALQCCPSSPERRPSRGARGAVSSATTANNSNFGSTFPPNSHHDDRRERTAIDPHVPNVASRRSTPGRPGSHQGDHPRRGPPSSSATSATTGQPFDPSPRPPTSIPHSSSTTSAANNNSSSPPTNSRSTLPTSSPASPTYPPPNEECTSLGSTCR